MAGSSANKQLFFPGCCTQLLLARDKQTKARLCPVQGNGRVAGSWDGCSGWQASLLGWPMAWPVQLELERLGLMTPESALSAQSSCALLAAVPSSGAGCSCRDGDVWGRGKSEMCVPAHSDGFTDSSHSCLPPGSETEGINDLPACCNNRRGPYCHVELGWVKPKWVRMLVFRVSRRTCLGDVSSLVPYLMSLAGFPLCSCVLSPAAVFLTPSPPFLALSHAASCGSGTGVGAVVCMPGGSVQRLR